MAKQPRIPFPLVGFTPPVYGIHRAKKPFTLDGNIEKPFWDDAPYTDLFRDIEGDTRPAPRFNTRAKMLWDDKAIYIAALMEGDEIWATIKNRDEVIFFDNDFEIFIDTASSTQPYFEFEMNALNTVWDLLLTKPYRDGGVPINSWDIKGLQTAVHINGKLGGGPKESTSWSVEVVIPFESMLESTRGDKPPVAGEFWRMNFSRVQWKTHWDGSTWVKDTNADNRPLPEDNWVWAPTGVINIHYPELWAYAFFLDENGSNSTAIPEVEQLKWQLRQVYYAQQAHLDFHGHFAQDLDALFADEALAPLKKHITESVAMEVTSHWFEASIVTKTGKTVLIFADGKTSVLDERS